VLALIYKRLRYRDFKILHVIETGMKKFEYVPVEYIEKNSKLKPNEVTSALLKLNGLKLIKRWRGAYLGYLLTWRGYDCLAIKSLVDRNALSALGPKIGVGKESDVYEGLAPNGERVTVKIHRVGRISFRQTARVRTYLEGKEYRSWVEQSMIAAQREFVALNELYKVKANVPKPLGRSRHVVVTSYIDGVLLLKYREAKDPVKLLEGILETIRKAYVEVGIVHGDLSEYNVMVELESEKPYIIDWPQYVYKEHPSAEELLKRDIKYIVNFFKRKYRIVYKFEDALSYIKR